MSRKAEIQVGVTVLLAVLTLILGVSWLKDLSLAQSKRTWKVEFPETGGLASSDEVLVNGMRKGEVRSMSLKGDRVLVELQLAKEITITRDTKVAIRNVGLMGEKVIAVDLRTSGSPYSTSDVIPGIYEKGIGEVFAQLSETVDAVSDLSIQMRNVAAMFSSEGKITNTIENFNRTSEELRLAVSENRASLRSTLSDFAAASKTAKSLTSDREQQLRQTLDHFASAAERLDALSGRLDSLRAVIQTVSGKVERGEGTLGKLVADEKLYNELNDSVRSLKALIEDVKANPKKYFKFSVF